jgi:hypothetical protein
MSSATVHPDTRAACRARLKLTTGLPTERAWEGYVYTPKTKTPFIEDELVGNGDLPRSNSAIEHRMSYIVTLKYPSDAGTAAIEAVAGVILDQFKVGTVLTAGSTSATCMRAERRGAILKEPQWLTLAVMVTLVAFTLD